jgi:myb proto-oncogene protein
MAEGQLAACWGQQDDGWRKGPWTSHEDKLLLEHVAQHGEGRWNSVSKLTGRISSSTGLICFLFLI